MAVDLNKGNTSHSIFEGRNYETTAVSDRESGETIKLVMLYTTFESNLSGED